MVINESIRELAQNMVRVQIANRTYLRFCILSDIFLSAHIIIDDDAKNIKQGRNKRLEKSEERDNKSPLML